MSTFIASLLVLIATCCLILVAMPKAEAPKPQRLVPQRAVLQFSCEERSRIFNARKRMEQVKADKGVM